MGKNMKKEDGVSPVIAVMLILGLTVVLLGLAAAMFMGITSNTTESMDTSYLHPTYEWDIIKIVYNANGGTGTLPIDESAPHNPGDTVKVAGKGNLYRAGYEFKFWSNKSDANGGRYSEGDELVINEHTTLYAIWSEVYNYYVSYDGNGNIYVDTPLTGCGWKGEGERTITIANLGSSSDKIFVKWEDRNNEKYYDPGNIYNGSDGTITLYAVWEQTTES